MSQEFYSNGKLLISGEYAILDGASGLAVPTKFGQSLKVTPKANPVLEWRSFDADGKLWFEAQYRLPHLETLSTSNPEIAKSLFGILQAAQNSNPNFLSQEMGGIVETHLTFPRNWGLGTSSTLINNIANWAGIDPYQLLRDTFGGSGYDIACAQHKSAITYKLIKGKPQVSQVDFDPPFKDQLFFVYLNEKKNSREAIANYRTLQLDQHGLVGELSDITLKMTTSASIDDFMRLMEEHELTLSKVLGIPPVKSKLFGDYPGSIKSLGAWGGDFILATGSKQDQEYFRNKGFVTVLSYSKMVL